MVERLDGFIGTTHEYISYLEENLVDARRTLNAEETPTNGRKRKRTGDPQWMECAKHLVRRTPVSHDWTSSLKEHGIHELLESGDAVVCLLDTKFESHSFIRPPTADASVIDATDDEMTAALRTYAHTTSVRLSSASTALALANFQKFLAISACAVLAEGDTPIAKVYDIVRICVGTKSKSSDAHCKRTLALAKYMNQLIDILDIHDWGQRAAELLLLCWYPELSY